MNDFLSFILKIRPSLNSAVSKTERTMPSSPATSASETIEELAIKYNWPSIKPKTQQNYEVVANGEIAPKVYFMIGCQRSGSNWLRTMLGEREDLIAPHPPHIMRDFLPILSKFGDLDNIDNLKILVDHVCTFVENNQVPWYDKHDRLIIFKRREITAGALVTVRAVRAVQAQKEQQQSSALQKGTQDSGPNTILSSGHEVNIDNKYYLLAIFDEIMNYYAKMNDKHTWMCKSMGMSKYHDMLLTMYGTERLRYIYLVRDPRDVTLSFMKTPVGDCHPYSVAKKWAKLQDHALYIKAKDPELLHEVRYEDVINDKVSEVAKINEFIGQRRTGKVMRRGSVVVIKDEQKMATESSKSHEATKAAILSYQFKNLTRGDSFTKKQFQKWRREMEEEDGRIVELAAKEQMDLLGYNASFIDANAEEYFTKADIDFFEQENKHLIEQMNRNLKIENPGDYERRIKQSSVLELAPSYITESFADQICDLDTLDELDYIGQQDFCEGGDMYFLDDIEDHDFRSWPRDANCFGFIPEEDINIDVTNTKIINLPSGRSVSYAAASQTGYYPRQRGKKNQDSYLSGVNTNNECGFLFAVFDGHGEAGTECSTYVKDLIKEEIIEVMAEKQYKQEDERSIIIEDTVESTFRSAYERANDKLMKNTEIDSTQSGTTAISLYIANDTFHVANVGDSRCIVASSSDGNQDFGDLEEGGDYEVQVLSQDQTPERKDEMQRIRLCGSLIMSQEEFDARGNHRQAMPKIEIDFSSHTTQTEMMNHSDDPLRIWASDGRKLPGCAFSRSIGDDIAKSLGVIAEPEYCECKVQDEHEMFILGSDGIFEFISNEEAVRIAKTCNDASEACRALTGLAYARWMNSEERCDDITVIVGFLS